jgi:hypothetical protein
LKKEEKTHEIDVKSFTMESEMPTGDKQKVVFQPADASDGLHKFVAVSEVA